MSTRSSARNLFPPLDNPELTIRRRPRVDPTLLNDFEMATDGNGDPPVLKLRTMEELLPGDDANKHLEKFLHVTQSIKVNGVTDDALRLYLFPHSLTHHATAWFDRLPRNSINKFEQTTKKFLGKYFPPSMVTKLRKEITNFRQRPDNAAAGGTFMKRRPEECYDLIKNMAAYHNTWDTSIQGPPLVKLRTYMLQEPLINVNYQNQNRNQGNNHEIPRGNNQGRNQFFQGASHGQNPPPAYQAPAYQALGYQAPVHQASIPQPNTITNPKEDLKGITTRSGNAYKGPTIPTTPSAPKVVERETEMTKYTVPPTNNGSTKDVQPPVVQIETPIPNSEPVVSPFVEPVEAPVSAPKPNPKPSIPYPSRLHDQKLRDKANDQKEKFFKIFKDLDFNISFADALILMPKFGPTIKSLLTNKEKLFKLARTPLNEHCSAVLLKNLPEKLGDPGKFLIPCDFLGMDECLALTDLGASINLMRLSVWNKLSLPQLSPMCMTLELVDRSISRPVGVAEDVYKTDAFLAIDDEPISSQIDESFYDLEGDIRLLEEFLNDDPSSPPLPPQELKVVEYQ
nr:reverse transcriptase domain-containing protein [Tanacetum cinerariifolium]